MRVLVATNQGQGGRDDDFFYALEGEHVHLPVEACIDDLCTCRDAVTGLSTGSGSTTFLAVERPALERDEYAEMLTDALEREGWLSEFEGDRLTHWIQRHVDVAADAPEGSVIRTRFERCDHDHGT